MSDDDQPEKKLPKKRPNVSQTVQVQQPTTVARVRPNFKPIPGIVNSIAISAKYHSSFRILRIIIEFSEK